MPYIKDKKSGRLYRKGTKMYKKLSNKIRRRTVMPLAPTGSFASRSETFSILSTAGQVYDLNTLNLGSLAACKQIANFYQYYRITSVQMRFKPNSDTYAPGGVVLPYLYFLYDKSGSLGLLSGPQFEAAGAKPVRVDDKIITRSWRPSVLMSNNDANIVQFRTSPWMPTKDSTGATNNNTFHLGAVWYISKINPADAQTYDIDVTVTVQFRKPLVEIAPGAQKSINALETIQSADLSVNQ